MLFLQPFRNSWFSPSGHGRTPIVSCFSQKEVISRAFVLEATGIDYQINRISRRTTGSHLYPNVYEIEVPKNQAQHAILHLSETLSEEFEEATKHIPRLRRKNSSITASTILFLSSLIMSFYVSGPRILHSSIFDNGQLIPQQVFRGQWYRLITAAYLHADINHLLGNLLFGAIFFIASSTLCGPGLTLLGWIATAAGGMLITSIYHINDPFSAVGASGGVFGMLGIITGIALQQAKRYLPKLHMKRKSYALIGASFGLLAWTGFSPQADIWGHIGGFGTGIIIGIFMAFIPPRYDTVFQNTAALLWFLITMFGFSFLVPN